MLRPQYINTVAYSSLNRSIIYATMSNTTVFVSGATGFISQHICQQLLAAGYTVIGLVRSAAKGDDLSKLLNSDKFSYEIVADIVVPGAFDEAMKKHPEITVFLHTAAVVAMNNENIEEAVIKPSVDGARNALEAILAHGPNVERVILTSSLVAGLNLMRVNDLSFTMNEESWNPVTLEMALLNGMMGYSAAKTFAERAAWKFVEEKKPKWSFTTINPVYVFGPQAFDASVSQNMNLSAEVVNSILKSKPGEVVNDLHTYFVDVRDVAQYHVSAITKEGAAGQRLISSKGESDTPAVMKIIFDDFPSLKGKIGDAPTESSELFKLSVEKSWKLLGEPKYSLEESIHDLVAQILKVQNA